MTSTDHIKPLLQFAERNLPKGYTFDTLSKTFMNPENLEKFKKRANKFDLDEEEIVNDREHYDY